MAEQLLSWFELEPQQVLPAVGRGGEWWDRSQLRFGRSPGPTQVYFHQGSLQERISPLSKLWEEPWVYQV